MLTRAEPRKQSVPLLVESNRRDSGEDIPIDEHNSPRAHCLRSTQRLLFISGRIALLGFCVIQRSRHADRQRALLAVQR